MKQSLSKETTKYHQNSATHPNMPRKPAIGVNPEALLLHRPARLQSSRTRGLCQTKFTSECSNGVRTVENLRKTIQAANLLEACRNILQNVFRNSDPRSALHIADQIHQNRRKSSPPPCDFSSFMVVLAHF